MRSGRVLASLVAVTAAMAVTSACGGSSGKSADDILTDAKAAVTAAQTYRIVGSGAQSGQSFDLSIRVNDAAQTAVGTAEVQGYAVRFIKAGGAIYVKAPAEFYQRLRATKAQIHLAADQWVKAPLTDPNFGQFASYADADAYLTPSSAVHKGDESTVDGYAVIAIESDRGRLFVRTTAPTLPVKLEATQAEGGSVTFDHFGQPVDVTAPPTAVDIADVQAAGQR